MLESSKLSSRFKKAEKPEVKLPSKLSFSPTKKEPELELENKELKTPDIPDKPDISASEIEENIKKELAEKIESIPVWSEYSEEKQKKLIKNFVENKFANETSNVTSETKQDIIENLYSSIIGFGPLEYLIAQENVSAIFVNGVNSVYIEIGGRILNTEITLSEQQLRLILNNIMSLSGIKPDLSKKIWNITFNNLQILIVEKSISLSGTNIIIRKNKEFDLNSILDNAFVSKEVLDFIVNAIAEKKNIVISGDINSGKTTFLKALINSVIIDKRTVLLEKDFQTEIKSNSFINLKTDKTATDCEAVVESALKLEPEYIVTDLNSPITEFSERKGYITTLRANSVDAVISKLIKDFVTKENFPEKLAKTTVLTNYDYIIQINKLEDGKRCITSIVELTPARTAALSVKNISKLGKKGYINDFPQPLTSFRAESLLPQSNLMSSRFYQQN